MMYDYDTITIWYKSEIMAYKDMLVYICEDSYSCCWFIGKLLHRLLLYKYNEGCLSLPV